VLALKLAEVWAAAARGEPPVFLFDDVGSELDADRTSRLLDLLTQSGAQVFASTTRADPLVGRVPGALWLRVEGGRVTVDPTPSPR
jgi:recombinational DNA repair ATPase RecF